MKCIVIFDPWSTFFFFLYCLFFFPPSPLPLQPHLIALCGLPPFIRLVSFIIVASLSKIIHSFIPSFFQYQQTSFQFSSIDTLYFTHLSLFILDSTNNNNNNNNCNYTVATKIIAFSRAAALLK